MKTSYIGYKFSTLEEAETASVQCNQYYGIPKSPEDVTQDWVEYRIASFDVPQFYYFLWDETLTPVLGNPQKFEVTFPDPPGPGPF